MIPPLLMKRRRMGEKGEKADKKTVRDFEENEGEKCIKI